MTTYNSLLSDNCEKYWEDLNTDEKRMLVNAHILTKSTVIPQEVQFQKAILNTLNVNLDKISHDDLLEEFLNVRNYLFQAIKEDIERDLEEEWSRLNPRKRVWKAEGLLEGQPDLVGFLNGGKLFK